MCICRSVLRGENRSTQNKTCPSATLSTTDSTQTDLGLNLDLFGDRLPTNTALRFPQLLRSSHTLILFTHSYCFTLY